MNFLAHAHLADITGSSITANLLGDFTKGVDVRQFNQQWQSGIKLHRKIDVFTDSHPEIKQCRIELGELRRYGGIIVDIIADHIIAKNFQQLSDETLLDFSTRVYRELEQNYAALPQRFQTVSQRMVSSNWFVSYQHLPKIELALARTAGRLSNNPPLAKGLAWYQANPVTIEERLLTFYRELCAYSLDAYKQLAADD